MTNNERSKVRGYWKHWRIEYGYNQQYAITYSFGSKIYPDISETDIFESPKNHGSFLVIDVHSRENKKFSQGIASDINVKLKCIWLKSLNKTAWIPHVHFAGLFQKT